MTDGNDLVQQISSVTDAWRIAAFAISAVLSLVSVAVASIGKRARAALVVLALLIVCCLGIAPIIADAYLRHAASSDVYYVRVDAVDSHNIPVQGAVLHVAAVNDTATNSEGVGNLTIPLATLNATKKITIYADLNPQSLHGHADLTLGTDMHPSITITLIHPTDATVTGIVEDDAGNALSGAGVSVVGGASGLTGADGGFTLKANAADNEIVRLHAQKTGYKAVDQNHPAGPDPVTIVLRRIRSNRH
jgi:hypothetical protein